MNETDTAPPENVIREDAYDVTDAEELELMLELRSKEDREAFECEYKELELLNSSGLLDLGPPGSRPEPDEDGLNLFDNCEIRDPISDLHHDDDEE